MNSALRYKIEWLERENRTLRASLFVCAVALILVCARLAWVVTHSYPGHAPAAPRNLSVVWVGKNYKSRKPRAWRNV